MSEEAPEFLVEFEAHTGAGVETLRYSGYGFTSRPDDSLPHVHFDARVSDPGYLETSLFGTGRTFGDAEIAFGEVVLSNADGGLDALLSYAVDGRALTIKRLAERKGRYDAAEVLFTGTMQGLDATGNAYQTLRIRLYDRRLELDKPLQQNRYGGTTNGGGASADGTRDLKDSVKPLCFGHCFKVPAVAVNPFDLIYQVHDGPVDAIQVYDAGVPLRNDGDVLTLAALQSATIRGGWYLTCKALGLFRLGGSPYKIVTVDVREGASAADRTAAAIAGRILDKMGIPHHWRDGASFDALGLQASEEAGVFISSERTALAVLSDVLGSIGGWIVVDAEGRFTVGRLEAPGVPAATFFHSEVERNSFRLVAVSDPGAGVPVWRVNLKYRPQWHQHQDGETADLLADTAKEALALEWLEAASQDNSVRMVHLQAEEMTVETLLIDDGQAAVEAARRLALYGVRRLHVEIDVADALAQQAVLGSTVTLHLPRFSFEEGRSMRVIGRRSDLRRNMVRLSLWG